MKQPEFAQVTGIKMNTLRQIECDRLPLSEEMARRIALATGVDWNWLMDRDAVGKAKPTRGKLLKKIRAHDGQDYNPAHYMIAQIKMPIKGKHPGFHQVTENLPALIFSVVGRLMRVFADTQTINTERAVMLEWRLAQYLRKLELEFGETTSSEEYRNWFLEPLRDVPKGFNRAAMEGMAYAELNLKLAVTPPHPSEPARISIDQEIINLLHVKLRSCRDQTDLDRTIRDVQQTMQGRFPGDQQFLKAVEQEKAQNSSS